ANRGELFQRSDGSRVRYDTAIAIDAQDESAFWTRSEAAVDGFISQGVSALENLREQRQMLKNARRNMFNVQGALGLSRTVIRNINRRTTQDKFILFGGMILTCFLIYLIIHYLG
ncbi:Golgi SNAP receptor complex member 2, partial [Spiromyces aspiralis]